MDVDNIRASYLAALQRRGWIGRGGMAHLEGRAGGLGNAWCMSMPACDSQGSQDVCDSQLLRIHTPSLTQRLCRRAKTCIPLGSPWRARRGESSCGTDGSQHRNMTIQLPACCCAPDTATTTPRHHQQNEGSSESASGCETGQANGREREGVREGRRARSRERFLMMHE